MASYPSQLSQGNLLPTTFVWNSSQIMALQLPEDTKRLLVDLYTNINNIVLALNIKDTGYYVQEEFLTGQLFFPDPALNSTTAQFPTYRQTFRKVINFGALPNATSKSVAHNLTITPGFSFTRIYGAATNPSTSFIPIPYASPTLNENISIEIDATNIIITTGIDRTAYTTCYAVIEYIKN